MNKHVTERDIRARLCYHVAMLVACDLLGAGTPTVRQLAELADSLKATIDENKFFASLTFARAEYDKKPEDKYAKSVEFQKVLQEYVHKKYAPVPPGELALSLRT